MDNPSGLSLLHCIILPVLIAGREGDPNPLISKLRADPNLDTGALSHVSLQDEGCLALFEWLTKGDDGKISGHTSKSEDARRPSVVEQAATSDDTTPESDDRGRTGFPRFLKSLELNDVGMSDLGFEALIRWLQSLHDKSGVECSEEGRITNLHLRFVRRILFLLDLCLLNSR
jgi:hypothetical protein